MFENLVDDVISSIHEAIKIDIKKCAQKGNQPAISESYFNEHHAKLKEYLQEELDVLLTSRCDVAFARAHIKYSSRAYPKIYDGIISERFGDGILAKFFEGRINAVLKYEKDEAVKQALIKYLQDKDVVNLEIDSDEKKVYQDIYNELKSFLLLTKANKFWMNLELGRKPKRMTKEGANLLWQENYNQVLQELEKSSEKEQETVMTKTEVNDDNLETHLKFEDESDHYEFRAGDTSSADAVIQDIESKCRYYITNRFAKLQKLQPMLPAECKLKPKEETGRDLSAVIIDEKSKASLPTEYVFENKQKDNNHHPVIDEITTVIEQYNKMQQLRLMLHKKHAGNAARIIGFGNELKKTENQNILQKNIDGALATVLFAINVLTAGLVSRFVRGTFKFWLTDPEIIEDKIASYTNRHKKVATKVVCNHTEATPRRTR